MISGMLELLETRQLLSAGVSTFVYTETNNAAGNVVLAYQRDPGTGSLSPVQVAGGAFATGGLGFRSNKSHDRFGPDDTDSEVIATSDGNFLFAVNQASNTVSEFAIRGNGRLRLQGVFASGGTQPVSLQYDQGRLYVLNRGNSDDSTPGTVAPTITRFTVSSRGRVARQPGATSLPVGISPSQLLVSTRARLLFVDNFATLSQKKSTSSNTLGAFRIGSDGALTPSATGPVAPSSSGSLLEGLAQNPGANVIYGGLPIPSGGVAVFTYDAQGRLTAGASVAGGLGSCWATVDRAGRYLYVANTGNNTIGVYSLNDPLRPVSIQQFTLRRPANLSPGSSTGAFQIAIDPSGRSLYVVNHGSQEGFQADSHLHSLTIATDGTVSESGDPAGFSTQLVTAQTHPQGLAIVTR